MPRPWRRPRASTRIGSSTWRYASWSRTAYPMKRPVGICGVITGCLCRMPPSRTGSRLGEKKAVPQMETSYLDWALADFSGSIAADELYDGPFCVLSIVDNRTFKRLAYDVLDHDPTHADITTFFRRFQSALAQRGLRVQAITTRSE